MRELVINMSCHLNNMGISVGIGLTVFHGYGNRPIELKLAKGLGPTCVTFQTAQSAL